MTKINMLSTNSRTKDVNAVATLILKSLAEQDWSSDTYLQGLQTTLSDYNAKMTQVVNAPVVYSTLSQANDLRNSALKALMHQVDGYTYNPDSVIQTNAEVVNDILEQFGTFIMYESYNEESADIEAMVGHLSTDTVAAACTHLPGVPEMIATLQSAQTNFEDASLDKYENQAVKSDSSSATDYKDKIVSEININLSLHLNAMQKVNADMYEYTAATIAYIIDKNNELVKRRSSNDDADPDTVKA